MHRLFPSLLFLLISAAAYSQRESPEQYIEQYKQLAIDEMKRSGVPAAITLAQGILESESGNSDLVKMSNNHFGIKCKNNWAGQTVSHDDDAPGECFRAYDRAAQSYEDHSDFLKNSPRYAALFNLNPEDYKGWAQGLKRAGYATNPRYADILIASVEKYNLNQYTLEGMMTGVNNSEYRVASFTATTPDNIGSSISYLAVNDLSVVWINGLKAIKVQAGTSLLAIAAKFNVRLSRLLEWNELKKDGILNNTQFLYLQKKKTEGSTPTIKLTRSLRLYDLAQEQGMLVKSLCLYNGVDENDLLQAGTVVKLRNDALESGGDQVATGQSGNLPDIHIVAPKEGLYSISKMYDVSVTQLRQWNHLTDDKLQIGQKLVINR